jgi:hypothetical protein
MVMTELAVETSKAIRLGLESERYLSLRSVYLRTHKALHCPVVRLRNGDRPGLALSSLKHYEREESEEGSGEKSISYEA